MPHKRSRFRRLAASASNSRYRRSDGVTLIETLIAATILVFGLLAIAQLLGVSVRGHQLARNSENAARLAVAKIEQLEKLDFAADAAIQITPGGTVSLDNNLANYFDNPTAGFTRRWSVAAGPTANNKTRVVTVRMTPSSGNRGITKPVTITTIVRSW
ncbi:MAG: hypothetical protein NT151_00255 [Acidobacteria bacterium]|nr:hypothetical protein [Acidobacteriota bacterium]